ncbi:trypsin-like cysteine/serine peptidase domain-containing protein [Hyaloraphidium curvatum]|nr:trypsin-like cysteine/serine peptidase domain-containing protein [Hyaloraphidium curvatum]
MIRHAALAVAALAALAALALLCGADAAAPRAQLGSRLPATYLRELKILKAAFLNRTSGPRPSAASARPAAQRIGTAGGSPPPAIIGGTTVESDSKYPFHAMLYVTIPFGGPNVFVCGAALVAPRMALTAGLCVDFWRMYGLTGFIETGRRNRSKTVEEEGGFSFPVKSFELHPDFLVDSPLPGVTVNDFAVLHLSEPTVTGEGSPAVLPINFRAEDPLPGSVVTAIGFGMAESDFFLDGVQRGEPRYLQQGNLTALTIAECMDRYNEASTLEGDPSLVNFTAETFHPSWLCAGGPGKSHCIGDSGSPLLQFNADGILEEVALASWYWDTCDIGQSTFARLSSARSWLEYKLSVANGSVTETTQTTTTATPTTTRTWATATPLTGGGRRYCMQIQSDFDWANTPQYFGIDLPSEPFGGVDVEVYFDSPSVAGLMMVVTDPDRNYWHELFTGPFAERYNDTICRDRPAGLPIIFDDDAPSRYLYGSAEPPTVEDACLGTRYRPSGDIFILDDLAPRQLEFGLSKLELGVWGLDENMPAVHIDSWCISLEGLRTRTTTTSATPSTTRTWATATPAVPGVMRYCGSVQKDLTYRNTPQNFNIDVANVGPVGGVDVELYFDTKSLGSIFVTVSNGNSLNGGPAPESLLFESPYNETKCRERLAGAPLIFDDSAVLRYLDSPNYGNLTVEEACLGTRYRPQTPLSGLAFNGSATTWTLSCNVNDGATSIYVDSWCLSFKPGVIAAVTSTLTTTAISTVTSTISLPAVTSTVTSVSVSNAPPVTLTSTTSLATITVFSTSTVSVPTTVTRVSTSVSTSVLSFPVTTTKVSTATKTVGKVTTTLVRTTKITIKSTKTIKVTATKTVTVKAKSR